MSLPDELRRNREVYRRLTEGAASSRTGVDGAVREEEATLSADHGAAEAPDRRRIIAESAEGHQPSGEILPADRSGPRTRAYSLNRPPESVSATADRSFPDGAVAYPSLNKKDASPNTADPLEDLVHRLEVEARLRSQPGGESEEEWR